MALFKWSTIIATALSALMAATIIYIMFQQNAQDEMYDTLTGAVDYLYSAQMFGAYFATFFLGLFPVSALVIALGAAALHLINRLKRSAN